eukprot:10021687-Prorocentrum_lima.AAC.1
MAPTKKKSSDLLVLASTVTLVSSPPIIQTPSPVTLSLSPGHTKCRSKKAVTSWSTASADLLVHCKCRARTLSLSPGDTKPLPRSH